MQVWYREGGSIMTLIALVGVAGLAIIAERLYVVVLRSKNNGRVFIERVIQLVRASKIDEAIGLCAASPAALCDMGLLILRCRSRDERDLQNVAAAALLLVVPRLTRRIQYLRAASTIAIMLGLLGTVHGFHKALLGANLPSADRLTTSLGWALTPTMFALAVATVLTLARAYLERQSESIGEEVREFSARLINALIDRPDVRLGHR